MKRKIAAISPLGLLTLAACGGSSNNITSSPSTVIFDGAAVKGPLDNALVFIDLNGNLTWEEGVDSDRFETGSDGAFTISVDDIPDGVTPNIVVVSTSATVDTSSGLIVGESFKLTAPGDASNSSGLAVTPVTTLLTSGELTEADVAAALGLEDVDNLLQYNPYEDTNAARALKVEQTSHQVMNVLSTLQAAGETAGLSAEASLDKSLKAFTEVIKVADADNPINLTDATDGNAVGLDALADSFVGLVEVDSSADAAKVANLKAVTADVLNGVSIVNERVAAAELVEGKLPSDLSEFVSTTNKLVADVATAVDLGNTDDFYIKEAKDAVNVAKNKAATVINLTAPSDTVTGISFDSNGNISIVENTAPGSTVAMVSSDDTGSLTYSVTSSDAAVAKFFEIKEDQDGVKLVLAKDAAIDFEQYPSLNVTVSVQDSFGKGFRQDFTFTVTDVNEAPTIAEETVTVAQGADLSEKLTIVDPEGEEVTVKLNTDSDLFALNGNVLSTKRAITQTDVDNGPVTLSITLTDVSGETVSHSLTVVITDVNDAPAFETNSIEGGTEGKAYTQKIIVADADGDDVTLELVDPPSWLSISADGVLSGTVPSDDTKIAEAETVTVKATDGQGGETVKDYILEYTNVNDAPEFVKDTDGEVKAIVVETADAIGVDAAQDSDNLSGTIVFNDSDPGDTLENLTVSLVGAGDPRSDGKIALDGSYGELVFDPTDFTYAYTPDVDKVETLHDETVKDDFTFKVFDDDGMSDSVTLSVSITGADDNPRLASEDQQDLITLGNNQTGTVVGNINIYDGSQFAGFVLADASNANDNDKFERSSTGQLKLKDTVTTSYATQSEYFVEVFAQDYDKDGNAVDGTKSSASATFTINVSAADPAPQVVAVETDYADDPLAIGEVLNFTVTLSEAAKSGGSTTMTLSNGARVTLSVGDANSQFLTGQYEIQEGDTDATSESPLEVASIVAGTVTDVSDQGLTDQTVFDELEGIIVDANAPTAKLLGSEEDPHTYDPSTGIMTLKGSSLGTVINGTSRDVVDIVNWSKLTWNIDGLGSTTLAFDASYVSSALVNADGTSITVQLNSVGTKALHELTDFGGLATSGGTPDTLNVDTGFLRDLAGNASSASSTTASEVYITDQTSPVLSSIEINGAFTSTDVTGRTAGDTFIVGDTLTFTATVSDASDLASVANMKIALTLSNNKQLNLVREENADGSVKTFSAEYVLTEDVGDVASLTIKSYSLTNIKDIAGNVADNDKLLSDVTINYTGVAEKDNIVIDATAPSAKLLGTDEVPHTYDAASGVLSLQGEGLKTIQMAADNTNVKTIVDWTKLTWNVDGEGSTTHQFSISDVATAVVNAAGTVLTVTLSAEGQDNLHSLEGFGGTAGTGGTKDALQVAAGFMKDSAGNLSTETSTAVTEVTFDDETALVLNKVSFDGTVAARVGEGGNIGFQAVFTDPSSATGTELADDAELVLTLNNGISVTLEKSEDDSLTLVGTYKVQAQDDTLDENGEIALDIVSIDTSGVSDVAGNLADATDALTKKDLGSTDVIVDTIAPSIDQVLYNSADQELVFVFKELLSTDSINENIAVLESFSETTSVSSSGTANTTITASLATGVSFEKGNQLTVDDDPFSFEDLAGNVDELYLIEIGAVIT